MVRLNEVEWCREDEKNRGGDLIIGVEGGGRLLMAEFGYVGTEWGS